LSNQQRKKANKNLEVVSAELTKLQQAMRQVFFCNHNAFFAITFIFSPR
jgi:hypothetical protein